jgi:hypothetical protein
VEPTSTAAVKGRNVQERGFTMKGLGVPIWIRIPLLVAVGFGGILALSASGDEYNGFDVSNASIPVAEILSGGPPRDGIPAIDEPSFISCGWRIVNCRPNSNT